MTRRIIRYFLTIYVCFSMGLTILSEARADAPTQLLSQILENPQPILLESPDPLMRDVIFWLNAQKGDSAFGTFDSLTDFILHHPHWARIASLQKAAEEKLETATVAPHKIIQFFKIYQPLTMKGQVHYIQALLASGQQSTALHHVRTYWQTASLSPGDQAFFLKKFQPYLTRQDHEKRLMGLLWRHDSTAIPLLLSYVSSSTCARAQKVLALLDHKTSPARTISSLSRKKGEDEILLWATLKALRHQKAYAELQAMCLQLPTHLSNPKAFHKLRILAAREWLEVHKPELAYQVLHKHGLPPGPERADAEWHLGWIALSFLKQPKVALTHFQNFEKNVRTPISLSRAAYWLGRAYQDLRHSSKAQKAFERAAHHRTTFYGQLACYELKRCPFPLLISEPKVTSQQRKEFEKHELVRAIRLLAPLGQKAHVSLLHLLCALGASVSSTAERQLVIQLASQVHPYIAVDLSRSLSQKDPFMPTLRAAYPTPPTPAGLSPSEKIFTWAICYRESRFNPTVRGDAGEIGLMQLMPETAREVACKLGLSHAPYRLLNPHYNMQLGSSLLRDLREKFNHNCFLAAAGYNAGCGAVNRWLQNIGDPQGIVFGMKGKKREHTLIDWIESIPYEGTRDYVQRAVEAYIVYAGCMGQQTTQVWKTLFLA